MIQFPAASKGGGMAVGFPDVCKVPAPPAPPVPTPFPNMAQVSSSTGTVSKVKIVNKDSVVETSKISSSKGDEAGTLKGMVSSTTSGECQYKKGSSKVMLSGKAAVVHLAMTAHNGSNPNLPAGGVHAQPSQMKVLVSP
jgi:hypothetical protein